MLGHARDHHDSCVERVRWVGRSAVIDLRKTDAHPSVEKTTADLVAVLCKNPDRIAVNMTQVTFLWDTVLCALIHLQGKSRKSGKNVPVSLFGLSRNARHFLGITRIGILFFIFETEEESLTATLDDACLAQTREAFALELWLEGIGELRL